MKEKNKNKILNILDKIPLLIVILTLLNLRHEFVNTIMLSLFFGFYAFWYHIILLGINLSIILFTIKSKNKKKIYISCMIGELLLLLPFSLSYLKIPQDSSGITVVILINILIDVFIFLIPYSIINTVEIIKWINNKKFKNFSINNIIIFLLIILTILNYEYLRIGIYLSLLSPAFLIIFIVNIILVLNNNIENKKNLYIKVMFLELLILKIGSTILHEFFGTDVIYLLSISVLIIDYIRISIKNKKEKNKFKKLSLKFLNKENKK